MLGVAKKGQETSHNLERTSRGKHESYPPEAELRVDVRIEPPQLLRFHVSRTKQQTLKRPTGDIGDNARRDAHLRRPSGVRDASFFRLVSAPLRTKAGRRVDPVGTLKSWSGRGSVFHYEHSIELQKLQVFGHLVYELHRALRMHQHIANMGRGCSPGPIPSTVVEPAAICVLPLGEGSLAKHGW